MEAFDYIAIEKSGTRTRGTLNAPTARDARDMLRVRDLTPVELKPARAKKAGAESFGKVKAAQRVQATRQLAILINADQPIEESLRLVAEQFENNPLRAILLDVRTRVVEGARLSQALAAHPKAFPDLYVSMVASGEGTGTLGSVLDRLATDLENAQAVRRRIIGAIAYPAVITVVAFVIIVLLMVVLVPKIVEQFADFDQQLPLLTRIVIGISEWMQGWGLVTLGLIIAAIFLFRTALRTNAALAERWAGFVLRLPVLGKLVRSINASRFARITASLVSAGSAPLAAMETSRNTLTNRAMHGAAGQAITRIREGSSISRALKRTEVFPPLVIQMVASGEATGDIAPMFDKSASYLEDEFEAFVAVFLALLQPIAIILLSGVVLMVIAAIMLPMVQLNTMGFQ